MHVALMVYRPDNRLAWGAHNDQNGYMLGCNDLLQRFIRRESRIRKIGAYRINGIVQAMDAGLYFPDGETVYDTWSPFIEADVYVAADFSADRLQWRAGGADGTAFVSPVIEQPFRNPMAGARALIELVFEVTGVPLPEDWLDELGDGEPVPRDLFVEWAKWIGYQPHWAHHAPWGAAQQSAMRILNQDPGFAPGAAWAIEMIMRDGSGYHHRHGEQPSPATFLQIPAAMRLLNTDFASAAYSYLRKLLPESGLLNHALQLLDLPMLDVSLALDAGTLADERRSAAAIDFDALKRNLTEPRVRRHLVEAVGRLDRDSVREALVMLLDEEADATVRVMAVAQLAAHHPRHAARVREAFATDADPAVRAAALAGLAHLGGLVDGDIEHAFGDADEAVRRTAVEQAAKGPLTDAARQALWIEALGDGDAAVRVAAIMALRKTPLIPADDAVRRQVLEALQDPKIEVAGAVLGWLVDSPDMGFVDALRPLLEADAPRIRLGAARALFGADRRAAADIIRTLRTDTSPRVQRVLADILRDSGGESAPRILTRMLDQAHAAARGPILAALYRVTGPDRSGLARAMRFDNSLIVNIAGLRLVERLGDAELLADVLHACADTHPNPYIRAEALRVMERTGTPGLRERCIAGIDSFFWVVRLEAADILSRVAVAADAPALRAALAGARDKWLRMAYEDALAQAEGRPRPERVRLELGQRAHTEGGNTPLGFQVWLGGMPRDPAERRRLVSDGYRFGDTTRPPNFAGGTGLNSYNRSDGLRNQYVIESVLGEIERRENELPFMYYLALFDEPCGPGRSGLDGMRAMLLEAGRPDLLESLARDGEEGLSPEWQRAFDRYDTLLAGEGSNWVVHMFRLTAQRKYQDLLIFPQSLSYMGLQDAFHMIDTDGDYTWQYHHDNFFQDGSIGAVNRVLHRGKPLNAITWMGWRHINVLRGNTLDMNTDFPQDPWRMRDYMGTKSALALWATGTEPGFFTGVSFAKVSDSNGRSHSPGATGGVLNLKPWSGPARVAVEFMLDDASYWRDVEARLALEIEKPQMGRGDALAGGFDRGPLDIDFDDPDAIDRLLDDRPSRLEEAVKARRDEVFARLMTGVGYMNIFNTDTTRVLSTLPKPDTSLRDTLIILGRDTPFNRDGGHFPIPAIAFAGGFDMLPTYEGIEAADLMHYDTILLRAARDGVTAPLVERLNDWLRQKEGGLLIVSGAVSSDNTLFPELTLGSHGARFIWEEAVRPVPADRVEETTRDRRGDEQTRRVAPPVTAFTQAAARHADNETRIDATFEGAVESLIETVDGATLLGRWRAPPDVRSIVLLDGATSAGPVYTEALEATVIAIDRERGSEVIRNPWWGHLVYENDAFVIDVATRGFGSLREARPRRHTGVDMITGVINPEVRNGECAVIFKDYVGPYGGGRGNWAVLARRGLKSMTVESEDRLVVEAEGVTRITRIGHEPIRLAVTDGFEAVDNQIEVWRLKQEGKPAYSINPIEGGYELHVSSPAPFVVVAGE